MSSTPNCQKSTKECKGGITEREGTAKTLNKKQLDVKRNMQKIDKSERISL